MGCSLNNHGKWPLMAFELKFVLGGKSKETNTEFFFLGLFGQFWIIRENPVGRKWRKLCDNPTVRRVTWLRVIFWRHYEMRENSHAHLTVRSVHSFKLTMTTKHFWGKKHLQGKKPTLWIKLDIKIKFWRTCRLFRLNLGARGAISHTCLPCLPKKQS